MSLTMRNYRAFLFNQAEKVSKVSSSTIKELTTGQLRMAFKQGIVDYRIALTFILKQTNLTVMANIKKSKTTTKKGKLTPSQFAKQHCKGLGMVEAIVLMGKKGYDQRQIIEAGYNKNTVYRQYREQVLA